MNAGFSNLKTLKRELLLAADAAKTENDASLAALGLGVAAMFDSFCNRKFRRDAAAVDQFSANRGFWPARWYPIESVTSVEARTDYLAGFVVESGQPVNVNEQSGLIYFGSFLGLMSDTVRITYAGGYWWDESETTATTIPTGATALPEDLRAAWIMQCRWFWERRSLTDRAKAGFAEDTAELGFAGTQDELLLPVRQVLSAYRRMTP
ncbi:MAG: hypothetical protein ACOYM3_04645 [Terrimicrobiaceae bacterium]